MHAKSLQSCPTLCDPMNHSLPGSSVHGILRQEYWGGLPCPPPGDLPDPGIEHLLHLLPWQASSLPLAPPGKPIYLYINQFSSVTQSCPPLCNSMGCSTPGLPVITNSRSLLKLVSIELVMQSNNLILCCSLFLLPSIFPSIRVFSDESVLRIRWAKYWSFSFNISPSNDIQDRFPLAMIGFISLQSKGLSRVFSNTTVKSINSLALSFLYCPTLTSAHDYWQNHSFDQVELCRQSNVSAF